MLEQDPRQALEHRVGVGLVREHRHRPALLGGEHRLVVPVGALDESHGDEAGALARPVDQAAHVVLGVAQVRLDDDAGVLVAAELVLVEELGEDREGEVAVAELLQVER